ncbi:Rho-binding antiterminator [Vibrio rumoiensis]|uniref:Rho-binding antiterminator n=1 Tax=Vibrio rumoiensis TaxID=76258 RepID=UPI000B5C2857|nr:Rho-binding antiterminator [Vibrio rumoiensis]
MKEAPYQPIACSRYDEFELACLHHDKLMIQLHNNDTIIATAINVYLEKETGEWFEVELDDGQKTRQRIRLDHIASFKKA